MKRYGERLVSDPELMEDAVRGIYELASTLQSEQDGKEVSPDLDLWKPH